MTDQLLLFVWLQSKLLERFLLLLECQGKSCDYVAFLATLGKVMESLPIQQLQSPATVELLTEQWVWLKRCVVNGKCVTVDVGDKSFLHLLGNNPLELQVSYLEHELWLYMESRHPVHSLLVCVLRDLVSLHTQLGACLGAALHTIHLAAVCLECPPQGLSAAALLDQALSMLTSIDHAPMCKVQQGVATAHLWKALVLFRQNIRYGLRY